MTHSNTVGSAIYKKIKDDIIYGKLQPSTRLKLDKLDNSLIKIIKKRTFLVKKVLESAIANAEHNNGADIDTLMVKTVFVNVGPTLKRFRARAKGSANRILKRSSHITIGLSDE